jgi:hypothetical protein
MRRCSSSSNLIYYPHQAYQLLEVITKNDEVLQRLYLNQPFSGDSEETSKTSKYEMQLLELLSNEYLSCYQHFTEL